MDDAGAGVLSINRDESRPTSPGQAAAGELAAKIAAIFADVFGVERIDVDDHFFDLGGDSLLAETLATAIAHETSCNFQISWLVEHGSPRKVAELLSGKLAETPDSSLAESGPARIFIVHGRLGFTLLNPAFYQTFTQPETLQVFELPGIRDGQTAYDSIEEIAAAYIAQLNQEYPAGPVFLAAFCHGALIALEMAGQLAEMGRPISQLVLIDPGIPNATVRNHDHRTGARRRRQANAGGPMHGVHELLRHMRYLMLVGRWTDGSRDKDFADQRLRFWHQQFFKYKLWKRQLNSKLRHKDRKLSIRAQGKLHAAFRHYMPRRFEGPVTILSSQERRARFEDETHIWAHLLPARKVQVLFEKHTEINNASAAETAREMQRIFADAGRGG